MLIILEGPDKTGKTTFAKKFKYREIAANVDPSFLNNYRPVYIHCEQGVDYLNFTCKWLEYAKHTNVIMDRSFISELIYGTVYRNKIDISSAMFEQIMQKLREANDSYIIMYFNKGFNNTYRKKLNKQDCFESNQTKLKTVHVMYKSIMKEMAEQYKLNIYEVKYL